jgi:hypothetical protein
MSMQSTAQNTEPQYTAVSTSDETVVYAPQRFRRLSWLQKLFTRNTACGIVALSAVFLDFPILPERQFFVSHLIVIGMVLSLFAQGLAIEPRVFQRHLFYICLLFIPSICAALYHGPGHRFSNDTIKLLIYALGVFSLARMLTSEMIVNVILWIPYALAAYCLWETISSENVFTFSGRFTLDNTGSPNTVGAMLALAVLPLWLLYDSSRQKALSIAAGVTLLAFLMLSFSRANIIGLGVAVVAAVPVKRLVVMVPLVLAISVVALSMIVDLGAFIENADVLNKANLMTDIVDRRSSSRLDIWYTLMMQYAVTPTAWIFGFGPGSVEYYVPSFTSYLNQSKYLYSPHSNLVGSFYYFGVAGLATFLALAYTAFRNATEATKYRRLKIAVFAFYAATSALDSHILASQGMFVHMFFISLLFSDSTRDMARRLSRDDSAAIQSARSSRFPRR